MVLHLTQLNRSSIVYFVIFLILERANFAAWHTLDFELSPNVLRFQRPKK